MSDKITYLDIKLAIVRFYNKRQNMIIPNYYINFGTSKNHECDLIIVRPSGYAEEVEIKMNKADLKADMSKKHGHVDERLKYLYFAMPEELYLDCQELIPSDAGCYTVSKYKGNYWVRCERIAPKKSCRKLTIEEQLKIAKSGVMRIWNLKEKSNI